MISSLDLNGILSKYSENVEEFQAHYFCYVPKDGLYDNIFHEMKIKPEYCEVFNKEVVYLGYAKSNYRPLRDQDKEKRKKWKPVTFIFEDLHKKYNIINIFPFDTGYANELSGDERFYFLQKKYFQRWNLEFSNIQKAIIMFFGDLTGYLKDEVNLRIDVDDFIQFDEFLRALKDFYELKDAGPQTTNIEVICEEEIILEPKYLIYPKICQTSKSTMAKINCPEGCEPIEYPTESNDIFIELSQGQLYNSMRAIAKSKVINQYATK